MNKEVKAPQIAEKVKVASTAPKIKMKVTQSMTDTSAALNVPTGPTGLIWDSSHWSCGYDTLFTPLAHLWQTD
jgi:hypothetical protein